jgi:hypothetical protein
MQNHTEIRKINQFLMMVSPMVLKLVEKILKSFEFEVKKEGYGLDLSFSIKKGEKEAKFYLQNLLLEIVTVDRDEKPLRFDENLRDFDFFLAKTARLTQSKLKILFSLLREEDVDAAIESINRDARNYERIRIWRFDRQEPHKKH